MPTRIDVQEWTEDPLFTAADPTGNHFRNIGNVRVMLYNGDASADTKPVDFVTQRSCNHGFVQNRRADVRRGYTESYGSLPAQQFNDHAGDCHLDYPSGTAGLQVAVTKMPRR